MPRILLVDDHSIIRSGLRILIEASIDKASIDEAVNGNEAFALFKANKYQLVILDINLPGTDTINLIENMKLMEKDVLILIFSMNPELVFAPRYLKLGVNGYLNKEANDVTIEHAIKSILTKKRYMSPELLEHLSFQAIEGVRETPFSLLSDREFEVALHLIKGKAITEIASFMHLHISTIGSYKTKVFQKCGVNSSIELNELAKVYNISDC
jgi:DNA-binding NarL/FixJ family response regulator